MQLQTKNKNFEVLEKYHQILLKENMKAAPDKSHFFFTCVQYLGHIIDGNTNTTLKYRIDVVIKLPYPSKSKKIKEFRGMLSFLK